MRYIFPAVDKDYQYLQSNRSNLLGNLWATFNTDFQSNLGAIRASQKLVTNTTSDDDADLGRASAFEYFDDRWFAICGTHIFKNSNEQLTSGFTDDASTGFQVDYDPDESDLAIFNDLLWSTTDGTLYSKASGSGTGTWTSRDTLGSGNHKLAYLKKFNRLYYVDTPTKVSSINTAFTVANSTGDYFIDIGNSVGVITTIVSTDTEIFIATMRQSNSTTGNGVQGSVLRWDGISSQATKEYKLESSAVLSMVIKDGVCYGVDSEGRVLQDTGYSFKEVARLPVDRTLLIGATSSGSSDGSFIHPNGMVATKNNTLLIGINNLNGDSGSTINENLPSGIWELDLSNGNFSHKHSFTLKTRSSSTVTDFGQNKILGIGALKLNTLDSDSSSGRGTLLCGASYYSDATTTKSAIFIDSPAGGTIEGEKRGYFVTNWIMSQEIEENWGRLWAVHKRFLNSTDKMVFKYRFEEETPTYATITWVNTTSFTTTTDVSTYNKDQTDYDGTYGGEVEIIQGTGSGSCSHIINVVNNAGTYTVTIDNAVTGVTTGTAKARFQKWIKLREEVSGQTINYGSMPIDKPNTRIQIKGTYNFTGDNEFHKMILESTVNQAITN